MEKKKIVYPYIPNSVEHVKKEMLDEIGVESVEDIIHKIPDDLRVKGLLDLPEPKLSEIEIKMYMEGLLKKNISCSEYTNFLGAGCYNHYVPAVCDEINSRSEFLTAYCGDAYTDHGKSQAIFEFTSLMSELVDMDVVALATYDGSQAVSTSLSMAHRITGRNEFLVPETMNPELLAHFANYTENYASIVKVAYDKKTGKMDLTDLQKKISDKTAAVFVENPSYLGFLQDDAEEIGKIAHAAGALFVVNVDPLSLGSLESPANYGADIVCGDMQCFGIHMGYGSGLTGFIASHQKPEYIMNFPQHLYGLYENEKGEFAFMRSLNDRTSYGTREKANEYLGTNSGLWAITVAVYLSLMGPQGLKELCDNVMYKCQYAMKKLSQIKGVTILFPDNANFKEFVVNFDGCGKKVAKINKKLLEDKIFGGKDLSKEFPELGESALYCVTELTSKDDIDRLAKKLAKILA